MGPRLEEGVLNNADKHWLSSRDESGTETKECDFLALPEVMKGDRKLPEVVQSGMQRRGSYGQTNLQGDGWMRLEGARPRVRESQEES